MLTDDGCSGSEDSLASLPFSKPKASDPDAGLHSASRGPAVKASRLSQTAQPHQPAAQALATSHNPPQAPSSNLRGASRAGRNLQRSPSRAAIPPQVLSNSASRAGRNLQRSPSRAAMGQEAGSKVLDMATGAVQAATRFSRK